MRLVLFLAFFLLGIVFLSKADAQYSFYGANVSISDSGKSNTTMVIEFLEPARTFRYTLFGNIEYFNYSDNLEVAGCAVTTVQTSIINCNFATGIKRLQLDFITNDFVKPYNQNYLFSADFSVNRQINQAEFQVKLPEGYVISTGKNTTVIPSDPSISSDGRTILLSWGENNVSADKPLQFQFYYESSKIFSIPVGSYLFVGSVFITGAILVGISFYVYFNRVRKPNEVIFSVLDDFERKVMNILIANKGEVNQKKVVLETNLSKAKISRVVKNLSDRGLIRIEKLGKTNKLKIVNKKLI